MHMVDDMTYRRLDKDGDYEHDVGVDMNELLEICTLIVTALQAGIRRHAGLVEQRETRYTRFNR